MTFICDRCGIQIESDAPLSRCKCGGAMRLLMGLPMESEDSDDLHGEYDYDPETGLDWPAEAY